jgi:hypothetical protein
LCYGTCRWLGASAGQFSRRSFQHVDRSRQQALRRPQTAVDRLPVIIRLDQWKPGAIGGGRRTGFGRCDARPSLGQGPRDPQQLTVGQPELLRGKRHRTRQLHAGSGSRRRRGMKRNNERCRRCIRLAPVPRLLSLAIGSGPEQPADRPGSGAGVAPVRFGARHVTSNRPKCDTSMGLLRKPAEAWTACLNTRLIVASAMVR